MLDWAFDHRVALSRKFNTIRLDPKFMFVNVASWVALNTSFNEDTWSKIEMVSLDKQGNIIGYMAAGINRDARYVDSLTLANFSDDKLTFGRDVKQFMETLLKQFYKINWTVMIGNPIEASYDKIIKRYGGRVVGIKEKHNRLMDGKLYDMKLYELFSPYFDKDKIV